MVDINDLLYWGSITISLNEEGKLVGHAMIELEKGYIPLSLSSEDLNIIKLQPGIMQKLQEGNVLYMIDGCVYLGRPQNEGSYGENKVFVSEADAEFLNNLGFLQNLEYKIENHIEKKKTLIRIGEFYKRISD